MRMQDYKRVTEKLYQTPKSVQELLPIFRIAKDGIFQLERKPKGAMVLFDKAYTFADTNFATMDEEEKEDFLKRYCSLLNSLNVSFKILLLNWGQDPENAKGKTFLQKPFSGKEPGERPLGELVDSYNALLQETLSHGNFGIRQKRLLLLTCRRETAAQARDYFRSIEANLAVHFSRLHSHLIPLNAEERLKLLHDFYYMEESSETDFSFSFDAALGRGLDWKDRIAPLAIQHARDPDGRLDGITLQVEGRYARAYYLPKLPNSINPDILQKLTAGPWHLTLALDAAAIPQEASRKRLMELYMQNGRAIEKQQEARNRARAWSSEITYERRREREELEAYLDILNDNDEKMFYLGVYAVLMAPTRQDLENDAVAFLSAAQGEGFSFSPALFEQLDVLHTVLPTGARFSTTMQPVFTQPLCALTPFIVQELQDAEGLFYGINQVSKNLLLGNRKLLKNGNGMVLGITGAGKGMETKQEIFQVFLSTKDDILIIDPQNEYRDLVDVLGGQYISFGAGSLHCINPLDLENLQNLQSPQAFLMDKTELFLGIFAQILDHEITAQDKSLIGRCVTEVYPGLLKGGKPKKVPTLLDYYEVMKRQPEPQAKSLSLALELFTQGSLNMFAQPTNVNVKNRLVCYGIQELGKEQSAIGMLMMLEGIRSRIAENARKGKATWLYIDEFHNLASQEFSAQYLEKVWKEVRKLGGLCTAITQNIADLLYSKTVETMLCNSEYLNLLSQSDLEVDLLSRLLGISTHLLEYVHHAPPGCGLLKFGDKYIPKDHRLPKDSKLYNLFNTNFHEIQKRKQKREVKKALRREKEHLSEQVRQEIQRDPTPGEKLYEPSLWERRRNGA